MNADSYFENEPWEYSIQKIHENAVGDIRAVAIVDVCLPGHLHDAEEKWVSRLDEFFGSPLQKNVLKAGSALSMIIRYSGPVIARLFLDEGQTGAVSSFEIVGTKGLLLWKPNSHPLSIIHSSTDFSVSFEHLYPANLGRRL